MKRLAIVIGTVALVVAWVPASALAKSGKADTYEFDAAENFGRAANGDRVEITCESRPVGTAEGHNCGTFTGKPKSLPVPPSGEFVHRDSHGNVVAQGTWVSTELINFDPYGCGFFKPTGDQLPPNFCGGALKLRVVLHTPVGDLKGILTVFCIVGPNAPTSHDDPTEEGVTLDVS